MLTAPVDTILEVTGGRLLTGAGSTFVNGLAVDSRQVTPGCAFVALPGDNVDGHDFGIVALENGARALIVTRETAALGEIMTLAAEREAAIIQVIDAIEAIQALATYHRARLHCAVVGVTGSTGKTTTKDLLGAVLSTNLRVVCTEGNRNNELGVPLTVLSAGSETDVLVVEMGMRGLGQIARLAQIARPTIALITNVGTSHIELLGSQDAVASAKGELVAALPADGAAFLNGDDSYSDTIAKLSAATVTLYGLSERCEVRAADIQVDDESRPSFDLVTPAGTVRVALPMPGRHNAYNALAAAAVGLHLGIDLPHVAEGLAAATLTAMRMQVFTSASGIVVVNDAYNANPVSMRAAIETLSAMNVPGKRVAVLGDMAELGSLTELAHFRIGEDVATLPVDELVTVGPRARRIAEGATAAGMPAEKVRALDTAAEALTLLRESLSEGDVVLVKASRVMGLESVVEGIVNPA